MNLLLNRFCCAIARLRKDSPLLLGCVIFRDDIALSVGEHLEQFILSDGLLLASDREVDVHAVATLAWLQQSSNSTIGKDDVVGVGVFLVC